jgi:hypothetical protein
MAVTPRMHRHLVEYGAPRFHACVA